MTDPNSKWNSHQMTEKVIAILRALNTDEYPYVNYPGQPYLSAYQIAIAFRRQFPDDFKEIDIPMGGKDSGERSSFTGYIASYLTTHQEDVKDIKVSLLHGQDLSNVLFADGIEASTGYLFLFRLR